MHIMVTHGAVCLWLDLDLCKSVVRHVSCVMVTYGVVCHGDTWCGMSVARHDAVNGEACGCMSW